MNIRQAGSAVTITASGALLFLIQPIAAKTLLPRFGGSAGVWVTCMMFFQLALLLGYLYSFWITRYATPAVRTAIHLCVLGASLAVLPVRPRLDWFPGNPTLAIVLALAASAGLPFFVLSSTGPLVQSWYAGARKTELPYHLFALSNIACLLALLAYPVAIEPALAAPLQLRWWSIGFGILAVLLAIGAIHNRAWTFEDRAGAREIPAADDAGKPLLWILLAACASALWLAVANYLSQEVAPVPFLWVLPLTVYLLSFVLCFGWEGCYRPAVFRRLLPAAWLAIGWRIGWLGGAGDLRVDIPVMLAALLVLCLFCHGELARHKPVVRQDLAFFYLMAAAGGGLGGVFVGVASPALFSSYLELPVGVVGSVFLALALVYGITSRVRLIRLAVLAAAAIAIAPTFRLGTSRVAGGRNFYGTLQVRDSAASGQAVRVLYSGRTAHGAQFLSTGRRRIPTAYYGVESGIGRLLEAPAAPDRRVAIVGLGAGTLAAYGRKGDFFRFYEINPAVIAAAARDFSFLADSAAATDVVAGDGRLRLAEEAPHSFDVIVLDAFSDDAIPVHLLTREAFQLYFARLRPGGALAIHITNRYLDLGPVVAALAGALGKDVLLIHSQPDPEQQTLASDWAVVSDKGGIPEMLRAYAGPPPPKTGPRWTDEYSNLFQIWR